MAYSNEVLLDMYERMVLSRVYEELVIELMKEGRIQGGAWHLAIGQEATQVGSYTALGPRDYYAPTFRNHGLLAGVLDINKFTAECLCKVTGYSRGKCAIPHINCVEERVLMANGILGASIPYATGYAIALRKSGKDSVVVASIGDGASNEGNFYEGINLAGVMEAPIVFLVENNGIGFTNPISNATRAEDLSAKGVAVGIPGITVDGNDVLAVREATEEAVKKARKGEPSIVEAKTVRMRPHAEGLSVETRDPAILEEAKKRDPIANYEKHLKQMNVLDDEKISEIRERKRSDSVEAFEFGLSSDFPTKEQTYDASLVYKTLEGNLS